VSYEPKERKQSSQFQRYTTPPVAFFRVHKIKEIDRIDIGVMAFLDLK